MRWLSLSAALAAVVVLMGEPSEAKSISASTGDQAQLMQRLETAQMLHRERHSHMRSRGDEDEDDDDDEGEGDEDVDGGKEEKKHKHREEEEDGEEGHDKGKHKHTEEKEEDGSEEDHPQDPTRDRSVKFAKKLQKATEAFILALERWTQRTVGNLTDVAPLLTTKFTLTTDGPVDLRRPCGALVGRKTFRVVQDFIERPATADLKEGDKLLWRPSRECLYGHNSIEVDGGSHIKFEMKCDDAVLLNASVASGGITRKVFWHNVEASGSFVAVDLMDGQVKTIGAAGALDALAKFRHIPDNLDQVLETWDHAVKDCAAKGKLDIRGVVGGGWRQKYTNWGSLDNSAQVSVVGYAEAFEIAYHPKSAATTSPAPAPTDIPVPITTAVPPPLETPVPDTTSAPTQPPTTAPPATTAPPPATNPATPAPVETPSPTVTTPPPPVPAATPAPPGPVETSTAPEPATTSAPAVTTPATPSTPAPAPLEVTPAVQAPPPATEAAPTSPPPAPPADATPAPASPPTAVSLETFSDINELHLPAFAVSFAEGDLKTMSETASGIYVQSGLECAKLHNTTEPCLINHALPKLDTQHNTPDIPLQVRYTQQEDFSSRSLLAMWPIILLIAIVIAAVAAVFVTYVRRRTYVRIPTTQEP